MLSLPLRKWLNGSARQGRQTLADAAYPERRERHEDVYQTSLSVGRNDTAKIRFKHIVSEHINILGKQ